MADDRRVLALHREAMMAVEGLAANVDAALLDDPTPCSESDLRTLPVHLADLHRAEMAAGNGASPPAGPGAGIDPVGDHAPALRWAHRMLTGTGALERSYAMLWSTTSGSRAGPPAARRHRHPRLGPGAGDGESRARSTQRCASPCSPGAG